jgi:hypothetical protein
MSAKHLPVFIIVAVSLATAPSASAESKSKFEGTNSYTGLTAPGVWTCPGGQPVPTFSCPPGTRTRVRGAATAANFYSATTGPATLAIVVNANYAPDFTGEMWGTWTIGFTSAGSTCEGSWTGSVRKAGNDYVDLIRSDRLLRGRAVRRRPAQMERDRDGFSGSQCFVGHSAASCSGGRVTSRTGQTAPSLNGAVWSVVWCPIYERNEAR